MSYMSQVLADAPIGYWRLGETSGSAVNLGSSGSTYDGTYTGSPTRGAAGLIVKDPNASVELGASKYVAISSGAGLQYVGGGLTIDFWYKGTGLTGGVVFDGLHTSGSGYFLSINHFTAASSVVEYMSLYVDNFSFSSQNQTFSDGVPHHLAAKQSGTTITYYKDGVPYDTDTSAISPPVAGNTLARHIGAYQGSANFLPNGTIIDEVAVYNTALSDARILAHYNAGFYIGNSSMSGVGVG